MGVILQMTLQGIFLADNACILIQTSLKFILEFPIENN